MRPDPLPETVRNGSLPLKVVYLYLLPLGTVSLTRRALAKQLGLSLRPTTEALETLELSGLLDYEGEAVSRRTRPYRVKKL